MKLENPKGKIPSTLRVDIRSELKHLSKSRKVNQPIFLSSGERKGNSLPLRHGTKYMIYFVSGKDEIILPKAMDIVI